jgi:hypothetical protein
VHFWLLLLENRVGGGDLLGVFGKGGGGERGRGERDSKSAILDESLIILLTSFFECTCSTERT